MSTSDTTPATSISDHPLTTNSAPSASTTPKRIILLSHPRSTSNLLLRILNLPAQPNLYSPPYGGYPFFPAYQCIMSDARGLYRKPLKSWTQEEREVVRQAYQSCFDKLHGQVSEAEERGMKGMWKEHCGFFMEPRALMEGLRVMREMLAQEPSEDGDERHADVEDETEEAPWTITPPDSTDAPMMHSPLNTTPLPDAYLLTFTPLFLLRHPALSYPSYRRATSNTSLHRLAPGCTLAPTRSLYSFFAAHSATPPILLAASDILDPSTGPALLAHVCDLLGLDKEKLKWSWNPATEEEVSKMPDVAVLMTKCLTASSGVVEGKGGDESVVVEEEVVKWRREFGEREARVLEEWVREGEGDWMWLWERRLRVPGSE